MPQLLSLEDWIKEYMRQHPWNPLDHTQTLLGYLEHFAGTLLTAAVADKLLQEALKPEPEDGK